MSTTTHAPSHRVLLATSAALLSLAAIAHGQVYVDGQHTGVVIQAQPVQRTYSQVYSASNHARLITKQSVMNNGGTIDGAQTAVYLQPGYAQPQSVTPQPQAASGEFRLNRYANARYLNYNYRGYSYYSNRGWYGGTYWYEYSPGFYYYWRPSYRQYAFPYRSYYGHSFHGYSGYGSSHYRGSSFHLSSHGLGLRVRF